MSKCRNWTVAKRPGGSSRSPFRTPPIIALTAHSALEDRQRCLDAGMNDQLAKPINPDRLFATLRRWLPQSPDATAQPPTVALTAESASALPELTGLLDTVAGLKRAGGDHTLYRSLLARYAAGQSDAPAQIQAALIAGDLAMAERLAHTLKGVSGAIGAITVQGLAATLEQALRQRAGWAGVDPLLVQTGAALAELIAALQAASLTEPALAVAAVDPAALASILKRLEVLLRDDDTEAVDYLADHRQTLAGALPEASFAALVQAVANYDFAEALRRLGTFNLLEAGGPDCGRCPG
ncbi:MAG: Hpt domain-containing protein [Chromatiaceae bacterium]|nr:Hpt domain-containing protein [Chromatiaceae bacterium]